MVDATLNSTEKDDEHGFAALMAAAQKGSEDAVWEIIQVYEPHLQRVIRRRLAVRLRSKFDTMDFVQMVWQSFFHQHQELSSFSHPKQLIGFLAKMALHKVDSENRRRLDSQKYNVQREEPLKESHTVRTFESPSQIAMARDHWDQVLRRLQPHHREIVRLRLEGLTFEQIAERLGLHERTVRRIVTDLLSSIHD